MMAYISGLIGGMSELDLQGAQVIDMAARVKSILRKSPSPERGGSDEAAFSDSDASSTSPSVATTATTVASRKSSSTVSFEDVARDVEDGEIVVPSLRSREEWIREVNARRGACLIEKFRAAEGEGLEGGLRAEGLQVVLFGVGGERDENGEEEESEEDTDIETDDEDDGDDGEMIEIIFETDDGDDEGGEDEEEEEDDEDDDDDQDEEQSEEDEVKEKTEETKGETQEDAKEEAEEEPKGETQEETKDAEKQDDEPKGDDKKDDSMEFARTFMQSEIGRGFRYPMCQPAVVL
ncbi:hypothetical protein F5B19DRAFT_55582 [Rostrohypoxylon terebratum]|nr:hypothetical protein F5B19DRAFT_55582 [Rostrohypoxylon terebratum]